MKSHLELSLLIGFLLVSCTGPARVSTPNTAPTQPSLPTATAIPVPPRTSPDATATAPEANPPVNPLESPPALPGSTCANRQVNDLGTAIASGYSFTTPQEVMTWFCAGADFEDILVALETQELTGAAAQDLLQMRKDGLSWEEIWQVTGLYNQ